MLFETVTAETKQAGLARLLFVLFRIFQKNRGYKESKGTGFEKETDPCAKVLLIHRDHGLALMAGRVGECLLLTQFREVNLLVPSALVHARLGEGD